MINFKLVKIVALAAAVMLSGCSILNPYDSEFSCPGSRFFGKCTDVEGAYSEALGGEAKTVPHEKQTEKAKEELEQQARKESKESGKNRYKDAEYTELAKVIQMPVTPIVTSPKVLRTLVVAYTAGDKTLYMPRYIFYIANDGAFVLGDYLSGNKAHSTQTLYPNSGRKD